MADRHIDLSAVDIGALQPPSSRRMIDLRDKRERGLALRFASKRQGATRSWCWRYRDAGGRQRRIVLGHWPLVGYEEAVRRFREARRALSAGEDPIEARSAAQRALDGRMSVSDLIERYEAVRSPALKSGGETMRLLRKHIAPAIGAIAVADVTGDHIRRLLAAERERLARDDAGLRKKGLKPRTFTLLSRIYAACGSLFSFAVAEEAIPTTPLPRLKKGGSILPAENAKARAFNDEEIAGFWSRIDKTGMDARTRTALKLVALTAMRPGEVLGLRRRDVDLSATFVDRRGGGERVRGNGLLTLRDTKNGLTRVMPLSPAARALAAEALAQRRRGSRCVSLPGRYRGRDGQADGATGARPRHVAPPRRLRRGDDAAPPAGDGGVPGRETGLRLGGRSRRARSHRRFGPAPQLFRLRRPAGAPRRPRSRRDRDRAPFRRRARHSGKCTGGGSRTAETEELLMDLDEAVEALKARDPRLMEPPAGVKRSTR